MRATLLLLPLLCLWSVPAGALFLDEEPANDARGTTPTVLARTPGLAFDAGILELEPGDVDWIRLSGLQSGDILTAVTTPLDIDEFDVEAPDTILGLFDSDGFQLAFSDDSPNNEFGDGVGSLIRFLVDAPGDYFLAVSGSGDDFAFEGGHTESGRYAFMANIVPVPEPSTAVLAGAGFAALAAARARRGPRTA